VAISLLEIDIGQLLPGAVDYDLAGVQFFDGPRRREAARGGHQVLVPMRYPGTIKGP
jgi:hypothetical protein